MHSFNGAMEFNEYYDTSDMALAAALLCGGCKLEALDRSNSRRALFIFEHTKDLDKILNDYWQDSVTVNPRTYFDWVKHLKTRLYGG